MGALEALLAAGKTDSSATPQGGALEKLLAGGQAEPAETGAPAPDKPAYKGGSSNRVVDDLVGGTADAIDLVWTGLFAAPVAMAGEALTRAQLGANSALGLIPPMSRREIGKAGQATAARLNEQLGAPVRNTLKALGLLSDRPMAVEKAMSAAMELVERDAKAIEERSGGVLQKEDALMGVNALFGVLGAKGVQHVAKTIPEQARAKAALKELLKIKEEGNARLAAEAAEDLNRASGGIPREPRPWDNPAAGDKDIPTFDRRANAERKAYELMQSGAPTGKVEAAIKKDPAVGAALEAMRKRREQTASFLQEDPVIRSREDDAIIPTPSAYLLRRPSEMTPAEFAARDAAAGITRGPLGEPIFSAGPADLQTGPRGRSSRDPKRRPVTDSGLMGTQAPPEPDVFGAAAVGGRSNPDPRRPTVGPSGVMGLPARPQADPFGAAATGGRASPDPVRRSSTGSGLEGQPIKRDSLGTPLSPNQTLAVVGATGLGLAAYYASENDPTDVAAAAAGGALLLGKGRGITLEAIRALPDTVTLREIRDASNYTLSTLENLPGNRAVHSKQAIAELLRRQEVTKAERDILQGVLDSVPGETITAKQLMAGVKEVTGDFELKPVASEQFADYGLENIDRAIAPDDYGNQSLAEMRAEFEQNAAQLRDEGPMLRERAAADDSAHFPDFPRSNRQAQNILSTLEASQRQLAEQIPLAEKMEGAMEAPTTTIYQSPFELGTNNHFGDPKYFAHTRSFYENGIKHVVEMQSDLAQRAGKVLTAEERAKLVDAIDNLEKQADILVKPPEPMAANDFGKQAAAIEARINALEGLNPDVKLKLGEYLGREGFSGDVFDRVDRSLGYIREASEDSRMYLQGLKEAVKAYGRQVEVLKSEHRAKLKESGPLERVSPMLKRWDRRLVREELAEAARQQDPEAVSRQLETARRDLAEAEETLRGATQPTDWVRNNTHQVETALYGLQVAAMDLRNGHATEADVRQRMLAVEASFPPDVRARWEKFWPDNGDETGAFLHPEPGEEGTWGNRYAAGFPNIMAEFLSKESGRANPEQAKRDLAAAQAEVARWEKIQQSPSVVRFATADTVAKVEGWPRSDPAERARWLRALDEGRAALSRAENLYDKAMTTGTESDAIRAKSMVGSAKNQIAQAEAALRRNPETPFQPEHQGIYDRYNKEVTTFLKQLGGKEVTDSAGHTWIEVPTEGLRKMPAGKRVQQFGAADPKLLAVIAAVGGGAYVASLFLDDKGKESQASKAGILASLALFGRSRVHGLSDMARSAVSGSERYLGMVSTQIGDMSPRLLRRARDHEQGVLTRTNTYLQAISPFVEGLRKVPEALRKELDAAILTGEPTKINAVLGRTGNPELVGQFKKARALLNQVGAELMQAGKLKGLLPDYYPRIVTDVPGLLKALGTEERTFIEKQIAAASHKTMKEALRDLTPFETSQIINKALKGAPQGTGKPGFLKSRAVEKVTPELTQFYAPASESLPLYLRAVSKELEKAKFFGDDLVRDPVSGAVHLDESIGNLVRKEMEADRITPDQATELGDILRSRFGPGERNTARPLQAIKNIAYAGLLGHVTSAITQLGDVAIAAAAHGILPTVKAIQQNLTGKASRATVHDLGLIDHMAEEFVSASSKPVTVLGHQVSTAKFLEKTFKYSGFSRVDTLGKNVSIQASKNKLEGWAKTPAGIKRLEAKYGKAYDPAEMQQLVADLRSGELSDLVKSVLFSELSDLQPISKLEVPQAYLDNPNGRTLYMLKGFMLKQADIVRRQVYKEMRAGNKMQATKNALRFGLALGIGGAGTQWINDWLLGRDREAQLSDIPLNMLKTFGWSQYVVDKDKSGSWPAIALRMGADIVTPPWEMFETIAAVDPSAIQYLPIFGRIYYARDWFNLLEESGSEKFNRRLEREQRRKEREE